MRRWKLAIDYTGSVEGIYAFIYCTKWRSGQVLPMPHSLTDSQRKDRATQLLIKYKSGALVPQCTSWFAIVHQRLTSKHRVWVRLRQSWSSAWWHVTPAGWEARTGDQRGWIGCQDIRQGRVGGHISHRTVSAITAKTGEKRADWYFDVDIVHQNIYLYAPLPLLL